MMQRTTLCGLAAVTVIGLLACATPAGAALPAGNVLLNGDAQSGTGASDSSSVAPVPVPGWTTTANLTEHVYGAASFPDAAASAAIGGGTQFFAGGPPATGDNTTETASQEVDVSAAAAEIDAGGVTATLAAALGGFESQADAAAVDATFLAADGRTIGQVAIGPVTAADRDNVTKLLPRTATAAVPAGTRRVRVVLTATRVEGSYNDGYADDVSLSLTAAAPIPAAASGAKHVVVRLPAGHRCVRRVRVTLRAPAGTAVVGVRAWAGRRLVATRRGSHIHAVTLEPLPAGRFRLRVVATDNAGAHSVASRSYRGCRRR